MEGAAAGWTLLLAGPLCLWAAWSDLARMKIPNRAVIALLAVFAVAGALTMPLAEYALRWLHFGVMLVAGFLMTLALPVGAGDAKLIAAISPFVARSDVTLVLILFAGLLLAGLMTHRAARAIPAVRRLAPHWESWRRDDFPMGLPLGATLICYLGLAAL